jgi:hypothetical protein
MRNQSNGNAVASFVVGAALIAAAIAVGCVGDDPEGASGVDGGVPPATVVDDGAPAGSANGSACATDGECASRHCADRVCCDTACDGVCESCALDRKGTCAAIAAGTDPEHECTIVGATADAGSGDGGNTGDTGDAGDAGANEGGLYIPDGGSLQLGACAGTCNGKRACDYPAPAVPCGPAFCADPAKTTSFHCDGKGSCALAASVCSEYACEEGACRTNCSGNDDCQATDYCSGNGQCVPKKSNGVACTLTAECLSGYCVQGPNARVCCASSCNDSGMQCDVPAKEGTCSCGGLTCVNGCRLFYVDADGDGYGDPTGTIANQRAVAGCIGTPTMTGPMAGKTYRANSSDCDDLDPKAFPGQTQFFDTENPRIGFDYDCSGGLEKELPEWPGQTCKVCTLTFPVSCDALPSCSAQCCGKASQAGFRCGFACPNGAGGYECCALPYDPLGSKEGFEITVGCGAQADYHVCGGCNAEPNNTPAPFIDGIAGKRTQRCH